MAQPTAVVHPGGLSTKCCIVAEVAQAHDGSLGTAHAFIDACARAGTDAIEFQTHIAAAESTLDEPWWVKFSRQDASLYDYWKRIEFTASSRRLGRFRLLQQRCLCPAQCG
jgi:N-acetylneuraminate synthase